MASDALRGWLEAKIRRAVVSSRLYAAAAMIGGAVVFLLMTGFIFVAAKIFVLAANPSGDYPNLWSATVALLVAGLLIADSAHADRDDFSVLPLWFVREHVHLGPRMIREGYRCMVRGHQLKRLDFELCVEVLACLSWKTTPQFKQDLGREFPGLDWSRLESQLSLIEGVLFFRSGPPRVILLTPLRLELRRLLVRKAGAPPPVEEPATAPEPEKLSPCDILGVSPAASLAEIKLAYRRRVKECHPDRFPGMDEVSRQLAEEWTKALNAAYETLKAERAR